MKNSLFKQGGDKLGNDKAARTRACDGRERGGAEVTDQIQNR
jgi:hypothetical protein